MQIQPASLERLAPHAGLARPAGRVAVIRALLVRDALMRYGHSGFGFFWVIGEPLLLAMGVLAVWSLKDLQQDVPILLFVLTGYCLLTMFRHMSSGFIAIYRRNADLLYHAHIRPLDILVARGVLECVGCWAAFVVAYTPLALLGYVHIFSDPLVAVGAWALGALYSFTFGLIVAGLTERFEAVERLLPALMYLALPLTGAFYMVDWLPPAAQEAALYSPLVHVTEMFRAGVMSPDVRTHWDVGYVLCWIAAQGCAGLLIAWRR